MKDTSVSMRMRSNSFRLRSASTLKNTKEKDKYLTTRSIKVKYSNHRLLTSKSFCTRPMCSCASFILSTCGGALADGQQKFLPPPRVTPQNSLDYGNLGKNLWLKKNQQQEENPKLRGKGTIGLPVGISSCHLSPSSSASGIGESRSMKSAISSAARASASAVLVGSSIEGLGGCGM